MILSPFFSNIEHECKHSLVKKKNKNKNSLCRVLWLFCRFCKDILSYTSDACNIPSPEKHSPTSNVKRHRLTNVTQITHLIEFNDLFPFCYVLHSLSQSLCLIVSSYIAWAANFIRTFQIAYYYFVSHSY